MNMPSTAEYQNILEHLTTAILLVRHDLSIYYMNSACENLLEMSLVRVEKQNITQLIRLSNNNDLTLEDTLNTTLQSGQPYTYREAILNLGLKERHVDYTVSVLQHNHLNSEHALLLLELRPIDQLLKISHEELLEQQHQIAKQLTRSVAHEIKNPLAGIRGATQLLARQFKEPQLHEYTEIIIHEVDRLCILADSMLGSRQLPHYETINIHEPLERVRTLILNQTNHQIPIIRDYDLSLPEVIADRDQIIQVLLNISLNAVQSLQEHADFFHDQQAQLTFRTRIQRLVTIHGINHRSAIRIDIEDNGIGINPELLKSIFYPMVTGRAQGTGLGLSIAQNIMRQHQGMIECRSEIGRTIFSIYFIWEQ